MCKRRFWKQTSHSTGVLSGELLYLGLLDAGKKKALETEHLYGSFVREIWREGYFTEFSERYVKEGSGKWASLSIRAQCWNLRVGGSSARGTWREVFLSGDYKRYV